jgi:hypothetical protein
MLPLSERRWHKAPLHYSQRLDKSIAAYKQASSFDSRKGEYFKQRLTHACVVIIFSWPGLKI